MKAEQEKVLAEKTAAFEDGLWVKPAAGIS